MKVKDILFITFFLSGLFFFATRNHAQDIRFGVQGGFDITSATGGSTGVGFHVGGVVELPVYNDLVAFEPALNVGMKTAGRDFLGGRKTHRIVTIDLPLLFSYHINLSPEVMIAPQLGPFVGFGLLGSLNTKNGQVSTSSDLFSEPENYQRLNYGISAGGYIRLKQHFQAGIAYEYPLADFKKSFLSDNNTNHSAIRLSNIRVTVCYLF